MVVDAVIRKWATLVGGTQEGAGQEVLGMSIQALSVLFYVDDGLVTSPGLCTNKVKKVSMACRPFHTPRAWSIESYTCIITGRGLSYREQLK